ncbi:MAG TPA: hypothetical protein VIY47_00760 [Ignavibacteriaceae bacterium]
MKIIDFLRKIPNPFSLSEEARKIIRARQREYEKQMEIESRAPESEYCFCYSTNTPKGNNMSLTKKEYVNNDGDSITEYRNEQGQLHNPNGPAVSGGKSPVYALNGNVVGETYFKACLALGSVDSVSADVTKVAQAELENHQGRSGVGPLNPSAKSAIPYTVHAPQMGA